jgi:hypothetical protein
VQSGRSIGNADLQLPALPFPPNAFSARRQVKEKFPSPSLPFTPFLTSAAPPTAIIKEDLPLILALRLGTDVVMRRSEMRGRLRQ